MVGSEWKTLTWGDVLTRTRNIASGLRALGLKDEERCSLLSGTRLEWILADYGIMCAAGATTTIYPANTAEECAYIIADSNTVFVFAENDDQVKKLVSRRTELPGVRNVIVFDGTRS